MDKCEMNFREHLAIEKKSRFLDAVRRASETIGVHIPHVNFNGCSFDSNENAHIHIEQNTICVSERYLNWATYEDIEDTAIHEVAHLIDKTHDFNFRKLQTLVKTASWKPSISPRNHLTENEKEQLYNYMEEDLRKWKRIEIDEKGEEYFLKGRTLFKRYLKDEIPNYKPQHVLTQIKYQKIIQESTHTLINDKQLLDKIKEIKKNVLKILQ